MMLRMTTGDALTAKQVYDIWTIRDAVFAVEQRVDEADADGIDLLATTTHLCLGDDDGLASYLRVQAAGGTPRIGRVCTRRDQRRRGLSGRLLREVVQRWGAEEVCLSAQAQLEHWYEGFGFRRTGPDFMEAGIVHVPMARSPRR